MVSRSYSPSYTYQTPSGYIFRSTAFPVPLPLAYSLADSQVNHEKCDMQHDRCNGYVACNVLCTPDQTQSLNHRHLSSLSHERNWIGQMSDHGGIGLALKRQQHGLAHFSACLPDFLIGG